MTDPQDPIALVRAVYAALAKGDVAAILAMSDPAIEIYQTEELPYGGHYRGHEGLAKFLGGVRATLDSKVEIQNLYLAGDCVVQIGRTRGTARATGAPFDAAEVHVWRVRDGRIAGLTAYVDTDELGRALRAASEKE